MNDVKRKSVLSTLDPKKLELILYPTEQCNFRCTYCYEDFELGKMTADTILGIKSLISERISTINLLQISWFGGEPLAAKDVIYELCEHAQRECEKHGVLFAGNFTTNGYFLDVETARRLQAFSQGRYQISIDGYGSDHDKTRKLMSGGGTFDRIWSNMKALRDTDIPFHITFRVHLTTENLESVERLAQAMREEFLYDKRFAVFIKPIENLGNNAANAFMIPKAEREAIHARISRAFAMPPPVAAARSGDTVDADAAPATPAAAASPEVAAPKICYAARPNSLAIRANGVVQKCTVLMSDDKNRLGVIGGDGAINIDRAKMAYWMRGYDTLHAGELQCPANTHAPVAPRATAKTIPIAVARE